MLTPDISFIFGTYNRLSYLRKCVASIHTAMEGTELTYELVIADGGSTDGTREWLSVQPKVVLLAEQGLYGAVDAFNRCFDMSRAPFVVTLNDDVKLCSGAISKGLAIFAADAQIGQVALAYAKGHEKPQIEMLGAFGKCYANYGIIRRNVAEAVRNVCGGLWNPRFHTYGGDTELSMWVYRLGWKIASISELCVEDFRAPDALRFRNIEINKERYEGSSFWQRWTEASQLVPYGPYPAVSVEEIKHLKNWEASPNHPFALRMLDLKTTWPEAAPIRELNGPPERVLHIRLTTSNDPQLSQQQALRSLGPYAEVDWVRYDTDKREALVLSRAEEHKPTLIFMQLQSPGVLSLQCVQQLRQIARDAIILTWCGDVGAWNGPNPPVLQPKEWAFELAKHVDLMAYTSLTQAKAHYARGMTNAVYLQIGYESEVFYADIPQDEFVYECSFLGQNYDDMSWADSLPDHEASVRRAVVQAFQNDLQLRFFLGGGGWSASLPDTPMAQSADIYRSSRFILSTSLTSKLESYSSDRLLRAMACGRPVLVKRFNRCDRWGLEHEKNCLLWDTPQEALMLYHKWKNDPLQHEIGIQGANLVKNNHTWNVRMQELGHILQIVRDKRQNKSPVIVVSEGVDKASVKLNKYAQKKKWGVRR